MSLPRYFHTLRHLRWQQIWYRLPILKKIGRPKTSKKQPDLSKTGQLTPWNSPIKAYTVYLGNNTFTFLNQSKKFNSGINWDYDEYGLLWTYNLNYFEYLLQEGMTTEVAYQLIDDFTTQYDSLNVAHDPYPISLRLLSWIKFFLASEEKPNEKYLFSLYSQARELQGKLEYHLLANHLFENGFTLLFAAYYFKDDNFYSTARKILLSELQEQILQDGAHYELSPMYHQIILYRILDSINLVKNNDWKNQELVSLLEEKASIMLGWLETMTFNSGAIPHLNDATDSIAPTSKQLFEYARKLNIEWNKSKLNDSGYRKFSYGDFEIIMDIGQIAPSYQPGHSHADNLNFVLYYKNKPIIVDTGISTYEKNERRQIERSTSSHNTVTINSLNSSEVWGGFRIAKRAITTVLKDTSTEIIASHNGYRSLKASHKRIFRHENNKFIVEDIVQSKKSVKAQGHIHFHPDVEVKRSPSGFMINDDLQLIIEGATDIYLQEYKYAAGFNKLYPAIHVIYSFEDKVLIEFIPVNS